MPGSWGRPAHLFPKIWCDCSHPEGREGQVSQGPGLTPRLYIVCSSWDPYGPHTPFLFPLPLSSCSPGCVWMLIVVFGGRKDGVWWQKGRAQQEPMLSVMERGSCCYLKGCCSAGSVCAVWAPKGLTPVALERHEVPKCLRFRAHLTRCVSRKEVNNN